ncbi:MAG: tRNA-dihydrouridine synthase family protein [Patescibacteria group bacterium]|nr:tRNA-dihydrouridine synthase family protein [Patescibacteria group bacterium]
MKNFWSSFAKALGDKSKLNKPIYALAPMAGVADSAFRQICKEFGADVVYSEMASVAALAYNPEKTLEMLKFFEIERPYVVQLFGSKPEHFVKAVKLIEKKKLSCYDFYKNRSNSVSYLPDGIDINFGCPVKKVQKQGAGAVLMNDLKLSREIIKAVINNIDLPVSIKIRSRVKNVDCLKFLDYINDLDIKAVMIHGRSLSQGFSGEIDVKIIKKARNYFNGIILANGLSLNTPKNANLRQNNIIDYYKWLIEETGADGVGIARGALGKPWIFKALRTGQSVERSAKPIFKIALKHAKLAKKLKGRQGIVEMRKHLCWYVSGLPGARKMREELVNVESIKDIEKILKLK